MKIKTLKDITMTMSDNPAAQDTLRNEAKKWIENYGEGLEEFFQGELEAQSNHDLIVWIKHFFNLNNAISEEVEKC